MNHTSDSFLSRVKKAAVFTSTVVGLTFFVVLSALAVSQINQPEYVEGIKAEPAKHTATANSFTNAFELAFLDNPPSLDSWFLYTNHNDSGSKHTPQASADRPNSNRVNSSARSGGNPKPSAQENSLKQIPDRPENQRL